VESKFSVGRLPRLLAVALFFALAMLVLYCHLVLWPQQLQVGQIAPYTIFAPVTFVFTDEEKLAELRGLNKGEQLAVLDPAQREAALDSFAAFQREFYDLRARLAVPISSSDADAAIEDLATKYGIEKRVLVALLAEQDANLRDLFDAAQTSLTFEMQRAVTDEYIRTLKQESIGEAFKNLQRIYVYFLKPNLSRLNAPEAGSDLRQLAQVQIQKGSVIIAEGAVVDTRIKAQLEALKPHLLEQNLYRYFGLALLLAAAVFLWQQSMSRFAPRLQARTGSIVQLSTLFIGLLIAGLLLGRLPFPYFYYSVTFAVATLATLVVLAYDAVLAVYIGLGLGLLLSIALGFQAHLTLYTLGGALLPTVYLSAGSPHKRQVMFAFTLGLLNALLALMVILISVQTMHWEVFVIAFISGFVAAILALGLLPVIEALTSQLTVGKLTELANAENEILKRLKREAHGTFVHSQMVADLTEEAVKDIGGDWLLARVGALYHDIGKLHRPGFFAENIHDLSKNPHQGLPPDTSVRILKDHVSDGLAMMAEARMPRDLYRFVAEHHGTYVIKFFFYQAMRQHEESPLKYADPDLREYCYAGPIPQTRESAVLMLADVTEAMTRARGEISVIEVNQLIEYIVTEKIEQRQLIDSGLTIGDLQRVKDAFVRILLAQRHHRLTYPGDAPPPLQFHFVNGELPTGAANIPTAVSPDPQDSISAASQV